MIDSKTLSIGHDVKCPCDYCDWQRTPEERAAFGPRIAFQSFTKKKFDRVVIRNGETLQFSVVNDPASFEPGESREGFDKFVSDGLDAFKYAMFKSVLGDQDPHGLRGTASNPAYVAEQKALNERARAQLSSIEVIRYIGPHVDIDLAPAADVMLIKHIVPFSKKSMEIAAAKIAGEEPAVDIMVETRKMLR